MSERRFTREHEWLRLEEDGAVTVGVTDYAQEQLGDVVYVELPGAGEVLEAGGKAAVIESVKAAGEVSAPVAGKVLAVNAALNEKPEAVNEDPAGAGWLFQLAPHNADDLGALLDEAAYQSYIKEL